MKLVRSAGISLLFLFLLSAPLSPPRTSLRIIKKYSRCSRGGDYKANVLKVNVPRSDLHVVISGVPTPTPSGLAVG